MTNLFQFALFVAFFSITRLVFSQARLNGFVTEQNSGKKPVSGVQVKSLFANPIYTGNDGRFILAFQNQQPGTTVIVDAEKAGWEVVNTNELSTALLDKPEINPLKIVMCVAGQLEKSRIAYYKIGDQYIRDEYIRRLQSLDHQKVGWQQKAIQYKQQSISLQKHLHEIADEYSRLNLDDLNATEQKAVQLFAAGQIDESIKLRESLNSENEITKALRRKATDDSIIVANTRNVLNLAKEYQLKFDFTKAESILEKLALTDTTNQNNTFQFAYYLEKQNQYDKAIKWYMTSLEFAKHESNIAAVQNNIGNLYTDMHKYVLAEKSYLIALDIWKHLAEDNNIALVQNNLGDLYRLKKDSVQVEKAYLAALEIYKQLSKINSQIYEPNLALTLDNLGEAYSDNHNYDLSEKFYRRALEIRERLAKSDPLVYDLDLAVLLGHMGAFFYEKQNSDSTEKYCLRALEIYERVTKSNPQMNEPYEASLLITLGKLYCFSNKKNYDLSEKFYRCALEILERLAKISPDVYEIPWCETVVGLAYLQTYGYTQARNLQIANQDSIIYQLATARQKLQHYSTIPSATQLLHEVDRLQAYFSSSPVTIQQDLNKALQTPDYSEKANLVQQVVGRYQRVMDSGHEDFIYMWAGSLGLLAWCQLLNRQFDQSEQSARKALNPVNYSKPDNYDTNLEWVNINLILALFYQSKFKQAEAIYLKIKDKLYHNKTYKENCLSALDELEKAGIISPDTATIRKLLRE